MNGIKQYFSSMSKEEVSSSPGSRADGKKIVSNMESVMKSVRKKKAKKKRLSGDGDITDISNILSCSLNLLSPKRTLRSVHVQEETPVAEDQENMDGEEKKNVFEVMMRKRRLPEEFSQEDTIRKPKKARKSLETKEDVDKPEENRKKSKRKKLFEIEVETVDFPRKDKEKSPEVEHQEVEKASSSGKLVKNSRKKTKKPKKKEILQEEFKEKSEIVQEKKPRKKKPTEVVRVESISSSEDEPLVNGRLLRSKKRPRKVEVEEIEEIVIESDIDSPVARPRRSCRQKISSYILETTFLDSDSSPEKPKASRKTSKKVICVEDYSPRRSVKLAPLFVKPQKLVINPEALKAKQEFLMSGVPEKIRQTMEKQREAEEFELSQFPEISHVTQINTDALVTIISWTDKQIPWKFREDSEVMCSQNLPISLIDKEGAEGDKQPLPARTKLLEHEKLSLLKKFKKIFENFPTEKAFSFFRKRFDASRDEESEEKNLLFTEKYRPETSEEFLVNNPPTEELKSFLESFRSDKFNSTFESINDPEDSTSSFANSCCVVLSGPCGSGKTSSVTAVAAELNFNVLEINAGMKRSGKRLLQELQEATQSHKVARKSFSLILVEDAEIAFEQDEGFVSALHQIVADSKRPVILTTTESNCSHLERFIAMNVIHFTAPSPEQISKWFTLMALAEGVHLQGAEVLNLYQFNGQDARRTINDLEFFARSGGGAAGDLTRPITLEGLKDSSFDTLWSNTGQWLKEGEVEGTTVEDFAEFYDLVSSSEVIGSRLEEEDVSQCLLEGALKMTRINMESYDHFKRPRTIERSCLSSAVNDKIAQLDYEPILRNICRSEQEKASRERKSSRFYHYLRQVVSNANNDVFIEHCKIFS